MSSTLPTSQAVATTTNPADDDSLYSVLQHQRAQDFGLEATYERKVALVNKEIRNVSTQTDKPLYPPIFC